MPASIPHSPRTALRDKLVLEDHRGFDVAKAAQLSAGELETWIRARLSGLDDVIPYGSPRFEEAPSDAIVDLYSAVRDSRFRIEFGEALAAVAQDYLRGEVPPPQLLEFLRVVERTGSDGPYEELRAAAREKRLIGRTAPRERDGIAEDLHRRLLFALGAIAKQIPSFWEAEMASPEYAEAAFFGLSRLNAQRALRSVPRYARLCLEHRDDARPPRLGPPLAYLIEQKQIGLTRVARLLQRMLANDPDARAVVEEALRPLGDDLSLDDAASADAVVTDCISFVQGRKDTPLCNALRSVRSADTEPPPLAFEEQFTFYSRYWVAFPTLDCTSLALHCMRVTDSLSPWLANNRDSVMQFLMGCHVNGFSISPGRPPSLYATLNAIGVLKAIAQLPQQHPLCEDSRRRDSSWRWRQMQDAIGADVLDKVESTALGFLRSTVGAAGLPVDCPTDPARAVPSVHALDYAVAILWNFGRANAAEELLEIKKSTVLRFLAEARRKTDNGSGFLSRPESKHQEPCTTTTAMVLRLCQRSECHFDFDKPAIISFIRAMQTADGGFRVFPHEAATLSATSYSLSALEHLENPWRTEIDVDKVRAFVDGCWRDDVGGYAFNPHPFYPANVHSTRQALRILRTLDPTQAVPADRAGRISRFLESLFDQDSGGFFGYPRSEAA